MINFFKPEDFSGTRNGYPFLSSYAEKCNAASIANAKLEREAIRVYQFSITNLWVVRDCLGVDEKQVTKKALLINIEPIEKCKHPIESIKANDPNIIHGFICSNCGAKVKPTSFEELG